MSDTAEDHAPGGPNGAAAEAGESDSDGADSSDIRPAGPEAGTGAAGSAESDSAGGADGADNTGGPDSTDGAQTGSGAEGDGPDGLAGLGDSSDAGTSDVPHDSDNADNPDDPDGPDGPKDPNGPKDPGTPDPAPAPAQPSRKRRHRIRNSILVLLSLVVVCSAGVFAYAAYDVHTLTRNLKHTVLLPPGFTQPPESVDAYGDSPVNILLLGSDTRDTSSDAALGGDSGPGANADSEMVVHLSADRSNATVLSIPRDTITELPDCAGGGDGMINSALQGGPECQVAAIHELTGLTIDHYVMFDFSGVVSISQDLGGIPVCVTGNVKDPNSGLTLDKGTTNVEGLQALQFLRTRDAFYDGSDIGRERATHYFFAQLIQQMKASASFTNLVQLQDLAQDVTRSTTVDNGLDSISALITLGQELNRVPTDRITFLIMPWGQDPDDANRVLPTQPSAGHVFAAMQADQSFTTDTGAAASPTGIPTVKGHGSSSGATSGASPDASPRAATPTPTPTPTDPAAVLASESADARAHPMHVNVINASGTTGRAATITQEVFGDGFVYVGGTDATWTVATTTLEYEPSEAAAAHELAADLGLPTSALQATSTTSQMTLTIGTDWQIGTAYPVIQPTPTPTGTGTATGPASSSADGTPSSSPTTAGSLPADSFAQNAASTGGCITVNPDDSF
ncbi:MAG TPA: LCP family protein [Actinocrinis sp.]|nr:LCP family protein [Actinocrinis sp.]